MKVSILDTVACAYQIHGDYHNGEKYMSEAIEIADSIGGFDSERKATYYTRLGDIKHSLGDKEEARRAWDIAAKLMEE